MRNKIYLLALLLLLMHLPILAQIGGGYDPSNPGDPGTPVLKYTLTLKAIPTDGGSFSVTSTKVYVGENYNIRAYPNTDFVFVAWICDGDTISKSASYNITMPDHDVEIIGVFEYNPSNPADPYEQALKYQLSLRAEPMNSGSFNINNERFEVGSTHTLNAYSNTDFVFKHWRIGDSILSTSSSFNYTMPAYNVAIIGQFEYSPSSPANPNANYWDPSIGEVIVDDFTAGYLSSAISALLNRHGANKNDVRSIIVAGKITSNDFGIANTYSNCAILDLRRVYGVNQVPSYAFDYTNIESVYLPETIEIIGEKAFFQCTNLGFLTIYAMTPPQLGNNVFTGVPEGLVVYVPAASVSLYQTDPHWGNYIILPIQDDLLSITVNFPDNTDPVSYTNMRLELFNTTNGQRMHYIMTDKRSFTFNGIKENSVCDITLRNQYGDVFGKIENILVDERNETVTFASLLKSNNVALTVNDPNGEDKTSLCNISWLDENDETFLQCDTIKGLPAGRLLRYQITLPQELATAFALPTTNSYTVKDGNNTIVCQLTAINQTQISGKVKDARTNQPLNEASISVIQTYGGNYSKTLITQTNNQGTYSLDASIVPTTLTVAASGYISQTIDCDMTSGGSTITVPDVVLSPITGAVVNISLTYTPAHAEGDAAETQNWYGDYSNVYYEVFNKTKNKAISDIQVQYPQIVLMEDVEDGDILEVTASSRKDAFYPVKTAVVISGQKATATIKIFERGKIVAKFKNNINPSVTGTLYDDENKLVCVNNFIGDSLIISDLANGNYKLIIMGSNDFYNSICDLEQFAAVGLLRGEDYVEDDIIVTNGIISSVTINEVPFFDEAKFSFTGEKTSFSVNKPSIVVGNYLTFRARIDFKDQFKDIINDVQIIVDLPNSCSIYENSVMLGANIGGYSVSGNRISIPIANYDDLVRFCAIPTELGDFAPSAFVCFNLSGKTITQPIGNANFHVESISSLIVPPRSASTMISVGGTALSNCQIDIYDNDVLIGHTTSMANSKWLTTCELYQPYNMSRHNIYAMITTDHGIQVHTETATCIYDKNEPQVSKVTQYNEQRGPTPYLVTWDFLNPSLSTQHYSYDMYDNHRTFSYTIEFTDNQAVDNVMLYVKTAKGHWWPLEAIYDFNKNVWVAAGEFGDSQNADLPVNVAVDFSSIPQELDTITTLSLFEYATHYEEPNEAWICDNKIDDYYISEYCIGNTIIKIASSYGTANELPNNVDFVSDTIFNDFHVFTHLDDENDQFYVFIPQNTISLLSALNDSISQSICRWANSICTKNFLYIMLTIGEGNTKHNTLHDRSFSSSSGNIFNSIANYLNSTNSIFNNYNKQLDDSWKRDMRRYCNYNGNPPEWEKYVKFMKSLEIEMLRNHSLEGSSPLMIRTGDKFDDQSYEDIIYGSKMLLFVGEIAFRNFMRNESYRMSHKAEHTLNDFNYNCPLPPDPNPLPNPGGHKYPGGDKTFCIDPSGFVYEGVPSNRLQGVTATCYYKETVEDMYGDPIENVVLWDAENYGQENPLITDENGYYRWDVPVGMWQVKYEKVGYETTYSDWLPVPPPQLDVNIGMVQMRQPEVIKARAYPKAVEFEFDKFMFPETLNSDNITVTVNGSPVSGTIELLNAEVDDPLAITSIRRAPGTGLTFASKVRFNANSPFNADKVTLHVKKDVKSYADLEMSEDYEAVLDVELEIQSIEADSTVNILYGDSRELTVTILPANASRGKTLSVRSVAPMIATTDAESYTLNNNGQAIITVHGDLPGMTSLLYSIEGYDLTASTLVKVMMESEMTVATPMASIASGSEVPRGTAVYLRCATEGSTIYYTLDGSCPCDDTPARKVYDGSPIIINGDITIKAMATAPDLYDSDVATFVYRVGNGLMGDVNGDGEVNIADVNAVIDIILGGNVDDDTRDRADVNEDGEINIADINAVINIILDPSRLMSHKVNCNDKLHLENVTMKPGDVRTLQLNVDHASHYIAMQCDIVLPAGLTLLNTASIGNNVTKVNNLDEMSSRALSYSPTKVPFASNGHGILTLTVRADEALEVESEIVLTHVVLADAENKAWHLADCKARVNNTSGVNDLTVVSDKVWVEGHTFFIEARHEGTAQLATINGIVCDIPVKAGVNQHRLDQGIYIVVINGVSHKIAIK